MEVHYVEWRIHPFRRDRWLDVWEPAIERATAFGAKSCFLTRNFDDPLHFRQVSTWESRDDFERYWASDEIAALRQEAMNYYNKPVVSVWHVLVDEAGLQAGEAEAETPAEVAD